MDIGRLWSVVVLCVFSISFIGCDNNQKFDSNQWKSEGLDWQWTDMRECMITDLIKSDTLIHKAKPEIIKLLGKPEIIEEDTFRYLVREKHTYNIDPDYIKYLVVGFDTMGISTTVRVHKYD